MSKCGIIERRFIGRIPCSECNGIVASFRMLCKDAKHPLTINLCPTCDGLTPLSDVDLRQIM